MISTEGASNLKEKPTQWQKYKKSFQKYYQKNKDYYKAYQKKYCQENKEYINLQHKESLRKRLEKDPQKIRQQQHEGCKRWRLKNLEKARERNRLWKKSLAGQLSKKKDNLRRRTGFRDRNKILDRVLNINFLKYGITLCENCGVACWENYQFDHIVPIVLGGKNEFDNFQILCPPCNLEKHVYAIDFRRLNIDA